MSSFHLLFVGAILIPSVVSQGGSTYQLIPGTPATVTISSSNVLNLVAYIDNPTQFLTIQVHTQQARLLLTDTASGERITGNSVGMVKMLIDAAPGVDVSWNVTAFAGGENVSAIVLVQEYGIQAPIPGACNQVFTLETDPNIRLTTLDHHTEVWFQWASVGDHNINCEEKDLTGALTYEVYVNYVDTNDHSDDALFSVVKRMMTADQIQSEGRKILTVKNDGTQKSLTTVTSMRGQGAVYGVVVTDDYTGSTASYVSGITYACNFTAGDCSLEYDAVEWVLIVSCAVVGLFLLVLGHSFLKTELALFGFMATMLIAFILLSMAGTKSEGVCLAIAAAIGVVGGGLWLFLWWLLAFPSISVMLPGLSAGFLVAGTIFFTPFANISWWASDVNYALVFACIPLLFAVLLLCSPRTLNIVSCSLVGGYCITMVAGILLRSSLRLIVLNVVHHASVPDFYNVLVVSPFLINDIILACVWALLLVLGVCWQFYRGKGKPHFPNQRRRQTHRRGNQSRIRDGVIPGPPPSRDVDERSPLLGNNDPPPTYQEAVTNVQRQPEEMSQPLS